MAKSNTMAILLAAVGALLFAGITLWVTVAAGGTSFDPGYAETPNATVPGPPAFK
jgi:hypothetical protein